MTNLAALYEARTTPVDPDAQKHRDDLMAALTPDQGRECPNCGNRFQRRADETWGRFQRRNNCGTHCARSAASKAAAAERRAARIEDLMWIAGTDTTESVAARLGYKDADSLLRTVSRWDVPDLLATLWRHTRKEVAA